MNAFISSWRAALRIARREAWRGKGRTLLVIAMIGVPMAALAFFAASYDMSKLHPDEQATQLMGAADARVSFPVHQAIGQAPDSLTSFWPLGDFDPDSQPGTSAELTPLLPAGSTTLPIRTGTALMRTPDGVGEPNAAIVNAASPLVKGYLAITKGRAPAQPDEIALSPQAATHLGTTLGGTATSGDGKHTYTVVGLAEFASSLSEWVVFAPASDDPPSFSDTGDSWLVKTAAPVTWDTVERLNQHGVVVLSRAVLIDPPPRTALATPPPAVEVPSVQTLAVEVLIAGLALLEIVLMAGPAFAVSARRRQRQLALVAANGGTAAHVRRIVLADGVVLGLLGAVVGIAVGILAAFGARPILEEHLYGNRLAGYRVFPAALVAIAALALVTGLLAALVPAFITARQNVVAALAGRRGVTRSRKRWVFVGLAGVVLGSAIVLFAVLHGRASDQADVMLAGIVIGELGLVLCTPALVGLVARIGRILPLAPRIALRDAARNRSAAAPAISAVMAAVAGSVAIGLFVQSYEVRSVDTYTARIPVGYVRVDTFGPSSAAPAQLEALLKANVAVTALARLGTVACSPQPTSGSATGSATGPTSGSATGSATGDAEAPVEDNRWCALESLIPAANSCPFAATLQTRALTAEEQAAARKDPRCADPATIWSTTGGETLVDDGSGLATLTNAAAADVAAARATLASGGVVVSDPHLIDHGQVTFAVINVDMSTLPPDDPRSRQDPVTWAPHATVPGYLLTSGTLSGVVVPPGFVTTHGLAVSPTVTVAATSRPPSQAEQEKLNQQLNTIQAYAFIEDGPRNDLDPRLWLVMAAAALITLAAAGVGTGLAAADGRADLSTLAAVGASPRMRRGLSLSQSAVIAGLGSVLGALAGLGTALAVIGALNVSYTSTWPPQAALFPLIFPWISVVVAVVVVPVLAMLGAGLLTRSRLPIERRI